MSEQLYVEYVFAGLLFGESTRKPIASAAEIDPPKSCLGYRTFSRTETTQGDEVLRGEARDYSPWTYFGRAMTLADVEREKPNERVLISNMRGNGYARVVMFPNGQTYELGADDRAIER